MTYGLAPQTLVPRYTREEEDLYWRQEAASAAARCYMLADAVAMGLDRDAWPADSLAALRSLEADLTALAARVRPLITGDPTMERADHELARIATHARDALAGE